MKKTNFFSAASLVALCAFSVQSCTVGKIDNPAGGDEETPKVVLTYDFAAAAAAEENPANFNGGAATGQVFYGWEKADKTDSKRQDYKGYAWAEGSVLPEVCHVWRRSDRINGNVKEGGLFCPNDREMAIDGLKEGSKVQIFYTAPEVAEKVSLKDVPFCTWDGWVNANVTGNAGCAWEVGTSTGMPYGDGSVINYADHSAYAKLVVKCTEGTPRFLFNRDVDEGQFNEDESQSHLIDSPKGGWCAKYFTSEEAEGVTTWTVDIAQLVKDKGYAHLHAIKGANWANVTVTEMTLEKAPAAQQILWAIGDGSSEEGLGVRAFATIDNVDAVTGETEIASGAVIDVKSVTPAENGTGYIVVKVKKNMVITKILIEDPYIAPEE